jgi:hypothetical protein
VERPQGKTKGKVKKRLTSRTEVGDQTVVASEDDPRYLLERRAARRPPTTTIAVNISAKELENCSKSKNPSRSERTTTGRVQGSPVGT